MNEVLTQATEMLPGVELELERAKIVRNELRAELHAAEGEVERLRILQQSLNSILNGGTPPDPNGGLVGWRVGEAAVAVLKREGDPLHYREVWDRMYEAGELIESEEPEAVVLTALTRHPDVERVGRGIYTLKQ